MPVRSPGHAGLPRQPRRPRLRHRGPAHRRRGHRRPPRTSTASSTGAAGFRMGPFELMDLIGLDVSQAVMESIYDQFYRGAALPAHDPAAPARLGEPAGPQDGTRLLCLRRRQARPAPRPRPAGHPTAAPLDRPAQPGGRGAARAKPSQAPTSTPASGPRRARPASSCRWARTARPRRWPKASIPPARSRWIRCSGCPSRHTLMTQPGHRPDHARRRAPHPWPGGVPVTVIHDSPGFVAQRVVATIVNVGCDIAQQRIASPEAIDRAVMLGLGYPAGAAGPGRPAGRAPHPRRPGGAARRYGRPALPGEPLAPPPRAPERLPHHTRNLRSPP